MICPSPQAVCGARSTEEVEQEAGKEKNEEGQRPPERVPLLVLTPLSGKHDSANLAQGKDLGNRDRTASWKYPACAGKMASLRQIKIKQNYYRTTSILCISWLLRVVTIILMTCDDQKLHLLLVVTQF